MSQITEMIKIKVTRQILDDNPGMEDQVKEGETIFVTKEDVVTETAKAAGDVVDQPAGDGYVGTRPPDGRP